MLKKSYLLFLAILFFVSLFPAGQTYAQDQGVEVVIIEATGPVTPPFTDYIKRGIDEADDRNAEAAILVLDTPGGQVDLTLELVKYMRNSDVPVIVFVGPRGAKAGSAGLFITLAGHAAAMAPETAIGASSPIAIEGTLDPVVQQKEEEFLSAEARSLAERRGPDAVQIANDAVIEARAVSANEALDANLVDFQVESVEELLIALDGFEIEMNGRTRTLQTADARTISVEMNFLESFLMVLVDPNIVGLLITIGPIAIIVEVRSPGGWVAGFVGVVCLGLGLYGLGILPVNWLGIVFLITAFVLFIMEAVTPALGGLSVAGAISLAVGLIVLFNLPELAPYGRLSIPFAIVQSAVLATLFGAFAYMAVKAQTRPIATGIEGIIGQVGRVTRDLDPDGMVLVAGERWTSITEDGEPIELGAEVEVVSKQGMQLVVRRIVHLDPMV